MDVLTVVLLLDLALLQFGGICSEDIIHYYRVGEETTLPCDKFKYYGPHCSDIRWSHWAKTNHSHVVQSGQVTPNPRSYRLKSNSDCSLTVYNITEEDYGRYTCARWNTYAMTDWDKAKFYLRVLSVSPAPSSQNTTENVTLQCTLRRHTGLCHKKSFRWLDLNGTVLSGESVTQNDCVSRLTVQRQSEHQRTFSCQFEEDGKVQVSAELRLKENNENSDLTSSDQSSMLVYIVPAAVVAGLVLLVVAAVVVFKIKSKRNSVQTVQAPEDGQHRSNSVADPENSVTYAMIDHQKPKAHRQMKPDDSTVTYSTVNIQTSAGSQHSALYSNTKETAQD